MKKNKVGMLFLVSMLAIAGIGVSYAGFSDTLTIAGNVQAATVQWNVVGYSGTWVWKVWGTGITDEIIITHDPIFVPDPAVYPNSLLVSWAKAELGTAPTDVQVTFHNIFPCVDFVADVDIAYVGTIPAKIWILEYVNGLGVIDDYTVITITVTRNEVPIIVPIAELDGFQIHPGDSIHVDMLIHLEQDNALQGVQGSFSLNIGILQWNEVYP